MIPLMRPGVGKEELEEVGKVLASGWLAQGPKVKEFEDAVAEYLGAKHVVATSSCTTALALAVEVLFGGQKGEVIVPNFTFPATANVVQRAGLKAVLADVDPDTWALNYDSVHEVRSEDTLAVMTMDPFGLPCGLSYNLPIIEDAATAFGSLENGKMVGHSGRAVCFSFHPRKVVTTGEGGALVTDDEEVADKARTIRSHGMKDGRFVEFGANYRMSSLQAAVGVVQVRKADEMIGRRMYSAAYYDDALRGIAEGQSRAPDFWRSNRQSYVVRVPHRDKVMLKMKDKGVETQIGTYAMSLEPAFKGLRRADDLSVSEALAKDTLTLPLFDGITQKQQDFVVKSLLDCLKKS